MAASQHDYAVASLISAKKINEAGDFLMEVRFARDVGTIAFRVSKAQADGIHLVIRLAANLPFVDAERVLPIEPSEQPCASIQRVDPPQRN